MRPCAVCGADNPPEARFCSTCGNPLSARCPNCGSPLPGPVNFCPVCGHQLAEGAPTAQERKLVTVLFADVTGSTGLGEQLDPEQLSDVMGAFFAAMRREIEAEGGTVEKFIGDAVMSVFGVPTSHDDDATRAFRAALRMRAALAQLNEELRASFGLSLEMRIGISMGEVLAVAAPRPGEGMIKGDAANVAARLEQAAMPGHILVSDRAAQATNGFDLVDRGPLEVRGRTQPVHVFELTGGHGDGGILRSLSTE